MGNEMAVAFTNIFVGKLEKEILREIANTLLIWKRFIDDILFVGRK